MSIKSIRGFKDILPEETGWWQKVEATASRVARNFGFAEFRIPVLERTELFARSIGADTDIVEKEMFSFADRHDESMTMRPEATAGIVRALIEHNLAADGRPLKYFFIGPMFRYERPQKGRQRQFHQLDVEAFNVASPHMDAEIVTLLDHFLAELGLSDVTMNINSLGCRECRPGFKSRLQEFLRDQKEELCADCQRRLETNPLRVLDCKVPRCSELVQDAPSILDSLCGECRDHFGVVQDDLRRTGVNFIVNPKLVRGLDYYSRTTFEAQTGDLGAQNAVAGGGRYDELVRSLGGGDVPGIGFAVGLERLIMLLSAKYEAEPARPDLYVAALDDDSVTACFGLVQQLRRNGLWVEADYSSGSLKSRMRRADKLGAGATLIVGPDELARKQVVIRFMDKGEQAEVSFEKIDDLAASLAARLSEE